MFSWYGALAVGSGGFLGAIARFYINSIVSKNFPTALPLATLSVNLIGSFLIGILAGLFMEVALPQNLKLLLITGFLGALTTYSTFALESYFLFSSSLFYAIINILSNLIGTILFVALGYKLILSLLGFR